MKKVTLSHLLPLSFLFAATANASAQTPISWKEDTAANRGIPFYFVDRTDLVTPETGLTITGAECVISKAGAAFANCAGTWVEIATGIYVYRPTQGEVDTIGTLVVKVDEAAARIERSTALVVGDSSGEAQSCTTTTIVLQSDSSSTDDFYNNQTVTFLEGNLKSVGRTCVDYTGSSKTCTVDTMPASCSSGDRYVILPPSGSGSSSSSSSSGGVSTW